MSNQDMIPYDPLSGLGTGSEPPHSTLPDSLPPINSKHVKPVRAFEQITLKVKLIGWLFIMPLYLYAMPRILARLLLRIPAFGGDPENALFLVLLNLFHDSIMLLLVLLLFRRFLSDSIHDLKQQSALIYLRDLVIGYVFFFAVNLVFSMITLFVTGNPSSQNQEAIQSMSGDYPALVFLMAVILAPIMEELIFRGLLFRTFRPLGAVPAILVSALAFGFLHVQEYVLAGEFSELVMMIPYVGMGLSLGIIYEKRKNILLNIGVHMLQNLFAMLVVLLLTRIGIY